MSDFPPGRNPDVPESMGPGIGLRLRIWLVCLGGAAVAAGGMWWVIGTQTGPNSATHPSTLLAWLSGVAGLALIMGAALALWLDRVLVVHMKGLSASLAASDVAELRGLPAASGWGELSELTQQVQLLVTHHRQATRAVEELAEVRSQVEQLSTACARWIDTERWPGVTIEGGPVAPVAQLLQRGLGRLNDVREQNQDAARQIGDELSKALEEARQSAEQAERGFVEATALLTTVRELQRLGSELETALRASGGRPSEAPGEAWAEQREIARAAIEELVGSSTESIGHLARGVVKVQQIADRVQVLSNRASLIALNSALLGSSVEPPSDEAVEDMRRLATEVREATEGTAALARDVEAEVRAATERMRDVKDRVAGRFEQMPLPTPSRTGDDPGRLLERVREMIQDATQKGERLSAAGERASRAADRLVRGLEEEAGELMGLVVRLSPTGEPPTSPTGSETPPSRMLRLLDQPEAPAAEPRARRPGSGEERS